MFQFGADRCDDPTTPIPDPATVRGFMTLLMAWAWYALGTLAKFKIPQRPNFRCAYLSPQQSGGADHKYGANNGGPQIFGGTRHLSDECYRGICPVEYQRVVVRNGRMYKVGWSLRRPSEYRGAAPRSRYTTSATLAAMQDV